MIKTTDLKKQMVSCESPEEAGNVVRLLNGLLELVPPEKKELLQGKITQTKNQVKIPSSYQKCLSDVLNLLPQEITFTSEQTVEKFLETAKTTQLNRKNADIYIRKTLKVLLAYGKIPQKYLCPIEQNRLLLNPTMTTLGRTSLSGLKTRLIRSLSPEFKKFPTPWEHKEDLELAKETYREILQSLKNAAQEKEVPEIGYTWDAYVAEQRKHDEKLLRVLPERIRVRKIRDLKQEIDAKLQSKTLQNPLRKLINSIDIKDTIYVVTQKDIVLEDQKKIFKKFPFMISFGHVGTQKEETLKHARENALKFIELEGLDKPSTEAMITYDSPYKTANGTEILVPCCGVYLTHQQFSQLITLLFKNTNNKENQTESDLIDELSILYTSLQQTEKWNVIPEEIKTLQKKLAPLSLEKKLESIKTFLPSGLVADIRIFSHIFIVYCTLSQIPIKDFLNIVEKQKITFNNFELNDFNFWMPLKTILAEKDTSLQLYLDITKPIINNNFLIEALRQLNDVEWDNFFKQMISENLQLLELGTYDNVKKLLLSVSASKRWTFVKKILDEKIFSIEDLSIEQLKTFSTLLPAGKRSLFSEYIKNPDHADKKKLLKEYIIETSFTELKNQMNEYSLNAKWPFLKKALDEGLVSIEDFNITQLKEISEMLPSEKRFAFSAYIKDVGKRQALEKNIRDFFFEKVKSFVNGEEAFKTLPDELKNDVEIAFYAVKKHFGMMEFVSDEVKKNKKFILDVIGTRISRWFTDKLKAFVFDALKNLSYTTETFEDDKAIAIAAITQFYVGEILACVSDQIKKDKTFIQAAVTGISEEVSGRYAKEDYNRAKAFIIDVIKAFQKDSDNFEKNFEEHKNTSIIALNQYDMVTLDSISEKMKKDKRFILEFIKKIFSDKEQEQVKAFILNSVKTIKGNTKEDREIILKATERYEETFALAPEVIRNNKTLCLEIIKKNFKALQFVSKKLRTDNMFVLDVIKWHLNEMRSMIYPREKTDYYSHIIAFIFNISILEVKPTTSDLFHFFDFNSYLSDVNIHYLEAEKFIRKVYSFYLTSKDNELFQNNLPILMSSKDLPFLLQETKYFISNQQWFWGLFSDPSNPKDMAMKFKKELFEIQEKWKKTEKDKQELYEAYTKLGNKPEKKILPLLNSRPY